MISGTIKLDRSAVPIEVVNRWQSFGCRCWTVLTRPWCVFAVSATSAVYLVALLLSTQRHFTSSDFSIYYVWGLAMRKGLDVYTTDLSSVAAGVGLDMGHWTKAARYPPTFILCFEPLSLLSPTGAWWTWATLNVTLLAVGLLLLLSDGFDIASGLVLGALAILYAPLTNHFHYAQAQILILTLLILAIHSIRRGREVVAGFSLALAGLLKVYPLLLVGYLLVRRRWGVLLYMGLTFGIGLGLTCAFVGLSRGLSRTVLSSIFMDRFSLGGVSVTGMISLVFWHFFSRSDSLVELARRATVLTSSLGVVVLTMWATSNYHVEVDENDPAFALWVVVMVLLVPTAWFHYLVLLLLPFGLLAEAANRGRASWRAIWFGVASYALAETLGLDNILGLWRKPQSWAACISALASLSLILAYLSSYFLLSDEGTRLHKLQGNPAKKREVTTARLQSGSYNRIR